LQDRLVKALRRAKISDRHAANRFLQEKFLPAFNRRFVRKAAKLATCTGACRVVWIWTAYCRSGRRAWCKTTGRFDSRTVVPVGRDTSEAGLGGPRGDGVTAVGRPAGGALWRSGIELPGALRPATTAGHGEAAIRSNQGQRPAADHPWRRGLPGAHRGVAGWGRRRSGSLRSPPRRRPT